jgi:hypothetical protein
MIFSFRFPHYILNFVNITASVETFHGFRLYNTGLATQEFYILMHALSFGALAKLVQLRHRTGFLNRGKVDGDTLVIHTPLVLALMNLRIVKRHRAVKARTFSEHIAASLCLGASLELPL